MPSLQTWPSLEQQQDMLSTDTAASMSNHQENQLAGYKNKPLASAPQSICKPEILTFDIKCFILSTQLATKCHLNIAIPEPGASDDSCIHKLIIQPQIHINLNSKKSFIEGRQLFTKAEKKSCPLS